MRTTLIPGMLDSLVRNSNRRSGQSRFFEVGNVHVDLGGELPEERKTIGIVLGGENESFYTLKGVVEELFRVLGLNNCVYQKSAAPYLQPGRAADVSAPDGTHLCTFGELHPDVANTFKADGRVYVEELRFSAIAESRTKQKRFVPLPRFPAAERDLAVVVDSTTESASLKRVIESAPSGVLVE